MLIGFNVFRPLRCRQSFNILLRGYDVNRAQKRKLLYGRTHHLVVNISLPFIGSHLSCGNELPNLQSVFQHLLTGGGGHQLVVATYTGSNLNELTIQDCLIFLSNNGEIVSFSHIDSDVFQIRMAYYLNWFEGLLGLLKDIPKGYVILILSDGFRISECCLRANNLILFK